MSISVDVNVGENPVPPNAILELAFYDESDAANDISLPQRGQARECQC